MLLTVFAGCCPSEKSETPLADGKTDSAVIESAGKNEDTDVNIESCFAEAVQTDKLNMLSEQKKQIFGNLLTSCV